MAAEVIKCELIGKGRLRVSFDNGESCLLYRGEARQLQIEQGQVLTGEQYERLLSEILGRRARKRALYLLEQMDRTEYKLREKLQRSEYPQCCIDDAVAYVKRFHYLDDERYAANFVRFSQGKMSRGKIRQKLMERGIKRELAERVIEEEYEGNENGQIMEILRKRQFHLEQSDQKEVRRTYQYLVRRGFPGSEVLKCMHLSCENLV